MKVCFVCGDLTSICPNVENDKSSFSGKALREILESISGLRIDSADIFCTVCIRKLNDYDELTTRAEKIQEDLRWLLSNKVCVKRELKEESGGASTEANSELENDFDAPATATEFSTTFSAHFDWNSMKNDDDTDEKRKVTIFEPNFVSTTPKTKKSQRSPKKLRENDKVFECSIAACGRRFPTQARLVNHMQLHSKERPFQCSCCGKFYKTKDCLRSHQRVVHKNADLRVICDACGLAFTRKPSLERHFKATHLKLRLFTCQMCGASYCNASSLQAHAFVHDKDNKNFECEVCSSRFHTRSKLNRHMRCHGEKQFECSICHRRYSQRYNLTAHMKQVHEQQLQTLREEKRQKLPIVCQLCGRLFDRRKSLVAHLRNVHEATPA